MQQDICYRLEMKTPGLNNNNLDGAIITGNKFTWNGTDETSTTHALFTGYNMDVIIKYNYLYQNSKRHSAKIKWND